MVSHQSDQTGAQVSTNSQRHRQRKRAIGAVAPGPHAAVESQHGIDWGRIVDDVYQGGCCRIFIAIANGVTVDGINISHFPLAPHQC